jgi:hypothetical protein
MPGYTLYMDGYRHYKMEDYAKYLASLECVCALQESHIYDAETDMYSKKCQTYRMGESLGRDFD